MATSPRETPAPSADSAVEVFKSYGLGPAGSSDTAGIPTDESRPDAGAQGLTRALAQLGGIYLAFARFLSYRADLLSGAYIAHLRRMPLEFPAVSRSAVAELMTHELGTAGDELAAALSMEPVWTTPSRTAYLSARRREPVIVEVAREPFAEETILEFEKSLRALGGPDLAAIVSAPLRSQFRDYLRNGESLARERSFLEVLSNYRGETLAEYPQLIPELCSPNVLCWPAVEGRPVAELIRKGDSKGPVLIASAVLEQLFSLSLVEADLDLDTMVVDTAGRLHVRRLSNPIAVLPGVIDIGIKYISSVVAGNAPRSAQTLIRMLVAHPPLDFEKDLMEEFSGVEPELKINMWFATSAGAFESNWRALAKMVPARPLFLDCLHRNLLAVGYWNSDAVAAGAPAQDALSEAMWPAVGQLLRNQFGSITNVETAQEWAFGSGMFMFSALREMNRSMEELRENDITIGVDCGDWRRPSSNGRRGLYALLLGGLFVLFLLSLQWGSAVSEPWSFLLKVLAVGALAAMFWAISKIR